jgi:hypothetical protein
MTKRHFQGSTASSDLYDPELEIALQSELRALADVEAIYEEQRVRG